MSVTIDATVGGASSNSFVTEVEMIAYMCTRLNASSWTTITGTTLTDDENRSLIESTREVTRLTFKGNTVTSTQALAWPRQNVIDPDDPNQTYFGTTVIPQRVKDATMEYAFQFIKSGSIDVAAAPSQDGIKRKKIDVLETEYFEYGQAQGIERSPRVTGWLSPLLLFTSGITQPLIKG